MDVKAVIFRPYGPRIRERVTALLASCGVAHVELIEESLEPVQLAAKIRLLSPDVLLVPFHAARDSTGEAYDGLNYILALHALDPGLLTERVVLMTVTTVGGASFRLRSARVPEELSELLHPLFEDELDTPQLREALERWLAR